MERLPGLMAGGSAIYHSHNGFSQTEGSVIVFDRCEASGICGTQPELYSAITIIFFTILQERVGGGVAARHTLWAFAGLEAWAACREPLRKECG